MNEPVTHPASITLGIKLGVLLAGFAGGVVSLAFIKNLTRTQAVMSVLVGALTAVYLTGLINSKLGLSPDLENGTAFIVGLCAMNLIPLITSRVRTIVTRMFASVSRKSDGDK